MLAHYTPFLKVLSIFIFDQKGEGKIAASAAGRSRAIQNQRRASLVSHATTVQIYGGSLWECEGIIHM